MGIRSPPPLACGWGIVILEGFCTWGASKWTIQKCKMNYNYLAWKFSMQIMFRIRYYQKTNEICKLILYIWYMHIGERKDVYKVSKKYSLQFSWMCIEHFNSLMDFFSQLTTIARKQGWGGWGDQKWVRFYRIWSERYKKEMI